MELLWMILSAVLPGIAFALFIIFIDRYDKEPKFLLIKVFVLGMLSTRTTSYNVCYTKLLRSSEHEDLARDGLRPGRCHLFEYESVWSLILNARHDSTWPKCPTIIACP